MIIKAEFFSVLVFENFQITSACNNGMNSYILYFALAGHIVNTHIMETICKIKGEVTAGCSNCLAFDFNDSD